MRLGQRAPSLNGSIHSSVPFRTGEMWQAATDTTRASPSVIASSFSDGRKPLAKRVSDALLIGPTAAGSA